MILWSRYSLVQRFAQCCNLTAAKTCSNMTCNVHLKGHSLRNQQLWPYLNRFKPINFRQSKSIYARQSLPLKAMLQTLLWSPVPWLWTSKGFCLMSSGVTGLTGGQLTAQIYDMDTWTKSIYLTTTNHCCSGIPREEPQSWLTYLMQRWHGLADNRC